MYDLEDNKIVNTQVVDTNGQGHGALAGFLNSTDIDVLICGGMVEEHRLHLLLRE